MLTLAIRNIRVGPKYGTKLYAQYAKREEPRCSARYGEWTAVPATTYLFYPRIEDK